MGTHRVRVTKPSEESGKETELEWERMRKQLEQENPGTLQERKKNKSQSAPAKQRVVVFQAEMSQPGKELIA